ncbi:MAG: YbhB/YbcL family Raf kinase inhibitor-like protein [Bacteroidota bacterium]|nr:YbhB/YbcL family Raf kinase inhibitor-like protein [Bacteroidota bacterium]
MKKSLLIVTCICVAIVFSCKKKDTTTPTPINNNSKFAISSPSFANGGLLPVKYTTDVAKSVFPPLTWVNPPAGTKSYVLIMDDPTPKNVSTWGHATTNWCVFNIPDTCRTIAEGTNLFHKLPYGAAIANNELGQPQYGPPSPPAQEVHTYSLRLYAIDNILTLTNGTSRANVWKAMQGHLKDSAIMTTHYY